MSCNIIIEILNKHILIFQELRKADELKYAEMTNSSKPVDFKSSSALFDVLRKKVSYTEAWNPFTSVLMHLSLLPVELASRPNHWILVDKMIQSVILSKPDGTQTDAFFLKHLDLNELLEKVGDSHELKTAKQSIDKLKQEKNDFKTLSERRRLDVEASNKERDNAMRQFHQISSKMEEITAIKNSKI